VVVCVFSVPHAIVLLIPLLPSPPKRRHLAFDQSDNQQVDYRANDGIDNCADDAAERDFSRPAELAEWRTALVEIGAKAHAMEKGPVKCARVRMWCRQPAYAPR